MKWVTLTIGVLALSMILNTFSILISINKVDHHIRQPASVVCTTPSRSV